MVLASVHGILRVLWEVWAPCNPVKTTAFLKDNGFFTSEFMLETSKFQNKTKIKPNKLGVGIYSIKYFPLLSIQLKVCFLGDVK